MRPKDPGERGVEFRFDAPCVLIKLRQGFLNGVGETRQLAVDVVLPNRRRQTAPLRHVADDPSPPHSQTR